MKEKIVVIGSGNWATTVGRIIANNVLQSTENIFEHNVAMWVYEEMLSDGRKLTQAIREENENVKYLPGHKLPPNLIPEPDLRTAVRGATCLVFATPLQFLHPLIPAIREGLSGNASGGAQQQHSAGAAGLPRVKAISLMKGVDVVCDSPSDPTLLRMMLPSDSVRQALEGVNAGRAACTCSRPRMRKYASSRAVDMLQSSPPTMHGNPAGLHLETPPLSLGAGLATGTGEESAGRRCTYADADVCVLMGANVANEVAEGQFCESTVGYGTSLSCSLGPSDGPGTRQAQDSASGRHFCRCTGCTCTAAAHAELWRTLLSNSTFKLYCSPDLPTVELCGALKNVVALGAGFVDALDAGGNTKAAIMRIGLLEMFAFCDLYCQGKLGPVSGRVGGGACLPAPQLGTLLQSCGLADLITTCYGGRNRKCAEVFARRWSTIEEEAGAGQPGDGEDMRTGGRQEREKRAAALWSKVEEDLLGGQKMQGLSTCLHIWPLLAQCGPDVQGQFPLLGAIHQVATGLLQPRDLFSRL